MKSTMLTLGAMLTVANVFAGGLAPDLDAPRNVHSGKSVIQDLEEQPSNDNAQRGTRTYRSNKEKSQKPQRKIYTSYRNRTVEQSSTQPSCADKDSLFSEAAVLYLWAKQDNMYLGESVAGAARTLLDPNFNWDPSFRVAFGYRNHESDWTLGLSWTYFKADPRTSAQATTINGLESASTFTSAVQNWKMTYNSGQLMFKAPASINGGFSLNAAIGVEAAFLHQRRDLDYVGASNMSLRDKNDFSGFGPSLALDGRFSLPCHFGFSADLGVSLLMGRIKAARTASGAADLQMTNNHNRVVPALHSKIGFDWTGLPKPAGITLFLGWEMHHFWDQWQVPAARNALLNPQGGSVSMSGLVFSADVCF